MRPRAPEASASLFLALVVLVAVLPAVAAAQEAILTRAATLPAEGVWSYRAQTRYTAWGADPTQLGRRVEEFTFRQTLAYGLTGRTALEVVAPLTFARIERPGGAVPAALDEVQALLKQRVWQHDAGPTDTARLNLFLGLDLPAGPTRFSGGGAAPMAGFAFTQVAGRHGANLAGMYTLTTGGSADPIRPAAGTADLFQLDAAYLYRLAPAAYSATACDAWYLTLESSLFAETNGDLELLLAPGLLFEGRRVAFELGVQLPAARRLEHRLAREVMVVAGLRLLF